MSIESISFSEYRKREGCNSHYLMDLLRSPAHAKWNKEHDHDTPSLQFGRAFHAAVLEPTELLNRFGLLPEDYDGRTKAHKSIKDGIASEGKTALTHEDMFRITAMNAAIRQHPTARKLMGEIESVEQSAFWEMSGIKCKSRMDARAKSRVLDLKSTTDASPFKFARSIVDYKYFEQAAHYLEGMYAHNEQVNEFVIIAVESAPPYGVAVYSIDQGFIDAGRTKMDQALKTHKQCTTLNKWPSYKDAIQPVLCPAWLSDQEVSA
jgi:hypothetical protein